MKRRLNASLVLLINEPVVENTKISSICGHVSGEGGREKKYDLDLETVLLYHTRKRQEASQRKRWLEREKQYTIYVKCINQLLFSLTLQLTEGEMNIKFKKNLRY